MMMERSKAMTDTDDSLIVWMPVTTEAKSEACENLNRLCPTWPDAFPNARDGSWDIPTFTVTVPHADLANEADDPSYLADYLAINGWDFDFVNDPTRANYRGVNIVIPATSSRTSEFIATVAVVEMLGRVRALRQRSESFAAWKEKNETVALAAIHPTYPDAIYVDSHNADAQTVKCLATGVKNHRIAIFTRDNEPVFQPCDVIPRAAPSQGVYVVTERNNDDHAIPVFDTIVKLRETKPEAYAALMDIVVEMTADKVAVAKAVEAKEKADREGLAAMTTADVAALSYSLAT
jgi:hypothetical protein